MWNMLQILGLGITIAGYTCEREELSGIFVKSVTDGSAADRLVSQIYHRGLCF
jgi:hypothetical protein